MLLIQATRDYCSLIIYLFIMKREFE